MKIANKNPCVQIIYTNFKKRERAGDRPKWYSKHEALSSSPSTAREREREKQL
jgi:hypothetical protein